jgi:very-short-patch-repair endonuclease
MYRARNAIFVGDSEQMRDTTIIFKPNKYFDELAFRFKIPPEMQIKATGSAVQSVLDMADLRGLTSVTLRYHYRSPKELIGFSNKYFYTPKGKKLIPVNHNYLPFRDTGRLMVIHELKPESGPEGPEGVNASEAKEILKFFRELRSDPLYKDKSVGILTFFNVQASYIRKLFEDEGLKEEKDNYKVCIVEGIQGDEKDIIIYSFVIKSQGEKNRYIALTGEGGDIRGDINKGRVCVAFSRARLQTHCFVSMSVGEFPDDIWIKKYLKYIEENGRVETISGRLKPFGSKFEEEVYSLLREQFKDGYTIQNQVETCGFKIDFVITDNKTGRKLALECDGPTEFQDEIDKEYGIMVETDEERQRVLEAGGWRFCRLKNTDWVNNNRESLHNYIRKSLS